MSSHQTHTAAAKVLAGLPPELQALIKTRRHIGDEEEITQNCWLVLLTAGAAGEKLNYLSIFSRACRASLCSSTDCATDATGLSDVPESELIVEAEDGIHPLFT